MTEPSMSTAETEDLRAVVSRMGEAYGEQERRVQKMAQTIERMNTSIQALTQAVTRISTPTPPAPATPPSPAPTVTGPRPEVRLPSPQRFDGDPGSCRGFLTQCALSFQLHPSSFPTEEAKVAYITTLMSGRALVWATALWEKDSNVCHDATNFMAQVQTVFGHPTSQRESAKRLLQLKQGKRSVAEYAIEFRNLAIEAGWEGDCLMTTFYHGLQENMKDALVNRDWGRDVEELIALTSELDLRARERRRERTTSSQFPAPLQRNPSTNQSLSGEAEEPMQLGRSRISQEEKDRRRRENLCLYCGETGHFRDKCTELSGKGKAH
ncbi:hypothetical protein ACEWY4_001605 [Coilia grayii]|uniref:CCHC-type domain-containing protein n=1 Tax=Coilia grayii TaxID=363190 RepID=A0ABD1KTH0_9TELE